MFIEILLFELKSSLRRPPIYIFFILCAVYILGCILNGNYPLPGASYGVFRNSPYVLTNYTANISLIGIVSTFYVFTNAAIKDSENDFGYIMFSLPITYSNFFYGRFVGALMISTIPFLGIFVGFILASLLGIRLELLRADQMGEIPWTAILMNYLLIIIPNVFITGVLTYILAVKFQAIVTAFVGPLIVIVLYVLSQAFQNDIHTQYYAGMIDLMGIRAYAFEAKYFTVNEKNTVVITSIGMFVVNRIFWLSCTLILLWIASRTFRNFRIKSSFIKKNVIGNAKFYDQQECHTTKYNTQYRWFQQTLSFLKIDFLSIVLSPVFSIILIIIQVIFIFSISFKTEFLGLKSLPFTSSLIKSIGDVRDLFTSLVIIFFAGQLVWRDRDTKMAGVINSTPHFEGSSILSKCIVLIAIGSFSVIITSLSGILYQLFFGNTSVEYSLYLKDFLFISLPPIIVMSLLSISLQRMIVSKYITYSILVLIIYVIPPLLISLKIYSHFFTPSKATTVYYTDMNGYGSELISSISFHLFWILTSVILLVYAIVTAANHAKTGPLYMFYYIRKLSIKFKILSISLLLSWFFLTFFLYYETQVRNQTSSKELTQQAINYEKFFKKFQNESLPTLTKVSHYIDIYPLSSKVYTKSIMKFVNKTNSSISQIHFTVKAGWKTEIMVPDAVKISTPVQTKYRIFKLTHGLKPDSSISIEVRTQNVLNYIYNDAIDHSICNNGTFITTEQFLPVIGYDPELEIKNKDARLKAHLPKRTYITKVNISDTTNFNNTAISKGKSSWIEVESTVSTSNDQYGLSSGSLIKKWNSNGRNYYNFKLSQRSPNFTGFISGKYSIASSRWKGITIQVYYDQKHYVNIQKIMKAARTSLEYYTENFGPYLMKEIKIIEFPGYEKYAQAFPGMIAYSESMGFTTDLQDKNGFNIVETVVAHELSHQWWGYQCAPAYLLGAKMLDETLAEYSSLMIVKKGLNDKEKVNSYLSYISDYYWKARYNSKEPSIVNVEAEKFIYYGKGALAMNWLESNIGERQLNLALQQYLKIYRFNKHNPNSYEFLSLLNKQVPNTLKKMELDWFTNVISYDLQLKNVRIRKESNTNYILKVRSKLSKVAIDSHGEHRIPLTDGIQIGVYPVNSHDKTFIIKNVKVSKNGDFQVTVPFKPKRIEIDPEHTLLVRDRTQTFRELIL